MGTKYVITEDQYEFLQKRNNFEDEKTPPQGEIVWKSLMQANDHLADALRLIEMSIQFANGYTDLEEKLIGIKKDISCGSNRVINCPDSCDIMGRINIITRDLGYIKRDNLQSNTIGS